MEIRTISNPVELERVERKREALSRQINEHKFTFTPEIYKKSPGKKAKLKKMKALYKKNLKRHV